MKIGFILGNFVNALQYTIYWVQELRQNKD